MHFRFDSWSKASQLPLLSVISFRNYSVAVLVGNHSAFGVGTLVHVITSTSFKIVDCFYIIIILAVRSFVPCYFPIQLIKVYSFQKFGAKNQI